MENITQKIQLFGQGKISENDVIITYDDTLKDDCFNLLSGYWTADRQYYYSFITSAELTAAQYPSANLAPPDFDITDYLVTTGDVEVSAGILFSDYGLTGNFLTAVVIDMNTIIDSVTADLTTSVSGLTADTVAPVVVNVESQGITDLQHILSLYNDNNDTNDYYSDNLDIVLDTESIVFTGNEKTTVKEILLEEFIRNGKYKIAERIQANVDNDVMYSKLLDKTIQKICTEFVPDFSSKTSSEGRRIGISLNGLMPTDIYIYNNSDQWELLTTAKNLMDEMDIAIKAMKNQGYPV